jgi:hypothetical protein
MSAAAADNPYDVVALADARRVEGAREAVNGPLDAAAVFARRDGYVTDWHDDGQADWLKGIGALGASVTPLTSRHRFQNLVSDIPTRAIRIIA